ncbi:uncharacterized protein C5L36_0B12620 [Pichia kudriavzevii]|uniref:Uncharacterized protein n=1 Tax=Pichia kudriavzevii TaxID=4909 RepID=A0A2U9R3Y1_PICKU|nr:uncharacterized protein C5L36_0B12620 [Pichia kudriavzevii]AWU76035.1 hypothetical protein C5L36_0B12620 [Pichia kudriavzevii]
MLIIYICDCILLRKKKQKNYKTSQQNIVVIPRKRKQKLPALFVFFFCFSCVSRLPFWERSRLPFFFFSFSSSFLLFFSFFFLTNPSLSRFSTDFSLYMPLLSWRLFWLPVVVLLSWLLLTTPVQTITSINLTWTFKCCIAGVTALFLPSTLPTPLSQSIWCSEQN